MKIDRIEYAKYRLPLTRPFRAGSVDVSERAGRLVRMTDDMGHAAYAEISPLPGLHSESLADAERVLKEVAVGLLGSEPERFGSLARNIGDRVAACTPGDALGFPSVCFGLQAAGAGLYARAEGSTPAAVWGKSPRAEVRCNALFTGGPDDAVQALEDGALSNYDAVKVKIGLRDREADRQVLHSLLQGLPESVSLRLDANRALSLEDAIARFSGLPPERIEYLEEPLANPAELRELHAQTGLPIAVDETLRDLDFQPLARTNFVQAWILKPTLIGHWKRLRFLAEDAVKRGKSVVITSTLDTGLGLSALAQAAAALPGADVPAGLATEGWLKVDMVAPRYDSSAGFVRTADWRAAPADRILERLRFLDVTA